MSGGTRGDYRGPPADEGEPLLERARQALAEERRRTVDERDAFADFRRRVRDVRPASAPARTGTDGGPGGVRTVALADDAPGSGLSAVRTAYRETVMDVPHFREEYDESYAESVTEEFGPDLAAALVAGDRFGPVCKRTLLDRVVDLRSELASVSVDGRPVVEPVEAATGADAGEETRVATDASFDALADVRADLCAVGERCDAVAADRQAAIHRVARRLSLSVETTDVPSYCYADLPVVYPVLSVVTDLGERVGTCRRAVERAMASAP